MIHSSGKRRRYKRYLSMFIAFVMVCSVFIPAFAKSAGNGTDGDEAAKTPAAITYEFYSDGELYDSQTVKDGETLKEPSEPDKDGSIFEGWYTSKDGGSKFTDFSKQSVTESKTVKLYARWQEVEESEPEMESVEADADKGTSGNDTGNSEEVSEEEDSGKKEDASEETGSDIKEEDSEEQTESEESEDVSDEAKNEAGESDDEDSSKTEEVSDKEDISKQDEIESSSDVSQSDEISEDSDKIKDEDTENVATEDETIVDSADNSDGTEKNEEKTAVTQPQRELGNGISPLDISGPTEVAVGGTITLSGQYGYNHSWYWSAYPNGSVRLEEDGNSVDVTGVTEGTVQITHRYWSWGSQQETYTIQVTAASSSRSYDLYMYTLIPGVEEGSSDNADDVWNGMGIGSISNVAPPGSYDVMTDIDDGYGSSGAVINDKDQNNREYPPITVTENGRKTTYYYAKTEAQEAQKGYYTIQWMRVRVSDGANDGNNEFNKPEVASGNNTYHLDGIVILNEENIYTVNFALKDVGGTRFIPDENFATRVKAGYDASNLKRPDKNEVLDSQGNPIEGYPYPLTKTVNGITYTFDGWYTDENCTSTTKVDFNTYEINANTTFYARYIPETQDVTVEKQVVGTTQEDATREFSFTYKYVDNSGVEKTGTLSLSDGENDSIEDVPVGADLVLTETNANGYTTSAQYDDETIQANETTGNTRTMTVQTTNDDSKIVVTNRKQIDETEPDANFIIVEKKFTGITEDQIPDNFQITVTGQNETSYTLTKNSSGWEEVDSTDSSIIWRWKISGVGMGKYTVSEENEEITDYTVTTTGIGDNVTVEDADVTIEAVKETTCSHTDWQVGVEGSRNFLFAAALTSNSGVIVISAEPLSASVRAAVATKILGGNWKNPVQFYSVSGNGYEYSIDGKIFTYDPTAGEIVIANTSDWSHVASLSYDVTEASNPEITITNDYKKNTSSITVKKLVTGNLSDYEKEFAFTASWKDSDGTQKTENFSLSHNNSETLKDLPVGTQVTISENRDDYSLVSIKQGNTELPDSAITSDDTNSSCTVTVTNEPMTITFTNEKEATVDVGIRMDNLPYILMLALVAGGAAAAVILRRRRG